METKKTKNNNLKFGQLTQYLTKNPYYTWVVNNTQLSFSSFNENNQDDQNELKIINQESFRVQCFRTLHIFPKLFNDDEWNGIINTALKEMKVIIQHC